jgi:hypothetical protein
VVVVPNANGRILGISVPRIPWHDVPVTPQEDEAFDALVPQWHGVPTDDSIHQALCVEEGCGRCAA